jgi:hypothetical protein
MRRALFLLPLALLACRKSQGAQQGDVPIIPAPAAPGSVTASAPAAPKGEANAAPVPTGVVQGKVMERLDAPPYSYLRMKTAEGEKWAAVPLTDLKAGDSAKVVQAFEMDHFESKKLNRTFDQVWLGQLEGQKGAMAPAAPGAEAGGPHAAVSKTTVDLTNIHVEKAAGADARTIAEVFAQRDALKGKTVVIKAKVVKFLPEIMNRNWAHLRDGSGTDKGLDNDIAVTSKDTFTVGDVVVVKGILGRKRDFGSGYYYDVILEDATLQK